MWGFLASYLYGHMSLFYVNLPHLIFYIREERDIAFIHYHCTLLCTYLGDVRVHEETLGEDKWREMSWMFFERFVLCDSRVFSCDD
jgi:hypothetical protein